MPIGFSLSRLKLFTFFTCTRYGFFNLLYIIKRNLWLQHCKSKIRLVPSIINQSKMLFFLLISVGYLLNE